MHQLNTTNQVVRSAVSTAGEKAVETTVKRLYIALNAPVIVDMGVRVVRLGGVEVVGS